MSILKFLSLGTPEQTGEIREKSNPCLCGESNTSRVSKCRWELHGLSHP